MGRLPSEAYSAAPSFIWLPCILLVVWKSKWRQGWRPPTAPCCRRCARPSSWPLRPAHMLPGALDGKGWLVGGFAWGMSCACGRPESHPHRTRPPNLTSGHLRACAAGLRDRPLRPVTSLNRPLPPPIRRALRPLAAVLAGGRCGEWLCTRSDAGERQVDGHTCAAHLPHMPASRLPAGSSGLHASGGLPARCRLLPAAGRRPPAACRLPIPGQAACPPTCLPCIM